MKTINFFIALMLISHQAFADVHTRSQVLVAGETQTWLSGQKKRVEAKAPMLGQIVIITRVDRGVEWILLPAKKVYQEKAIALPYIEDDKNAKGEGADIGDYMPKTDEEGLKKECVPEILRLPNTRKIAGFDTTGFTIRCGNEKAPGNIWMAPPVGMLAEVEKQDKAYNHEHAMSLFSKYPSPEREEFVTAIENLGDLAKKFVGERMAPGTQFPRGVLMAMEGKGQKIFEIKEIQSNPVDPGLFEVPADYRRVSNIAQAVIDEGLKNLEGVAKVAESFKKFLEESGLAGMAQRAQKAFEQYSQNRT